MGDVSLLMNIYGVSTAVWWFEKTENNDVVETDARNCYRRQLKGGMHASGVFNEGNIAKNGTVEIASFIGWLSRLLKICTIRHKSTSIPHDIDIISSKGYVFSVTTGCPVTHHLTTS